MTALRDGLRPVSGIVPADRRLLVGAVAVTVAAALSAVWFGIAVAGVLAGVLLVVVVARHPVLAVYIYLGTLPFLAGIERGTLFPLVRANEAVLVLVVGAAFTGGWIRYLRGAPTGLHVGPLDLPLAVFVVASAVWPLLSLMLRGIPPSPLELASTMPVLKLAGLLLLARVTVTEERHRLVVMRIVVWTAVVIAVIAVLQAVGFSPVVSALTVWWNEAESPDDGVSGRGTTTFASSIATGDYLVMAVALLTALALRGMVGRRQILVAAPLLAAGVLASAQFSAWLAMAIVATIFLRRSAELRRYARRGLPLIAFAALLGAPAATTRLAEFGSSFGMPRSWLGRWDNLVNFYLPPFDLVHVLLGISPNSVLTAPETWREQIYLEFGYLHLLWVGGLPLLAAFAWLTVAVLRRTDRLRDTPGALGGMAAALHVGWWLVLLLSLIDVHLVLRGMGDLLFVLLGVVAGRADADRPST